RALVVAFLAAFFARFFVAVAMVFASGGDPPGVPPNQGRSTPRLTASRASGLRGSSPPRRPRGPPARRGGGPPPRGGPRGPRGRAGPVGDDAHGGGLPPAREALEPQERAGAPRRRGPAHGLAVAQGLRDRGGDPAVARGAGEHVAAAARVPAGEPADRGGE